MVQIEARFTGISISQGAGTILPGRTSVSEISEAVFQTSDGDVMAVSIDHWTCGNSLVLVPGDTYVIGARFETASSRLMGLVTLTLRATAHDIIPMNKLDK